MRSSMTYLAAAAIGVLTVVGCGRAKPVASAAAELAGTPTYTNVTAQQLHEMLQAKDFVFVNVHVPYDGDIRGTDLSIPFDQVAEHLDQLPAEKTARIVLYCRSGRMSETASSALVSLGYTHVFNVTGGMQAWSAAGHPLEHRGQPQD